MGIVVWLVVAIGAAATAAVVMVIKVVGEGRSTGRRKRRYSVGGVCVCV